MSTFLYLSVVKAAFEPFQCEDRVTAPPQETLDMIEAIVMLNRTLGGLGLEVTYPVRVRDR